jgi:hypothetical protein
MLVAILILTVLAIRALRKKIRDWRMQGYRTVAAMWKPEVSDS